MSSPGWKVSNMQLAKNEGQFRYHYIYYVAKNPLEEMEEPSQSTNESKIQYLGVISKMTEWSLFVSKANHSVSVIQVYASTTNAEEAEIKWFYDDIQNLLELTPKKGVL